jgi:hypothetical protein
MRNSKHIEAFIERVTKEANEAAQLIFDKYQKELEEKIYNQLQSGDWLSIGNGSASIENKKGDDVGEDLADVLSRTQYPALDANFSLDDIRKP